MKTIIIQPPLVQLNTPYPSGAYLLSFFKKLCKEENASSAEANDFATRKNISSAKENDFFKSEENVPPSQKSNSSQENAFWFDLSTDLFHKIFCRKGIEHIFSKSSENALKLARQFENQGDENSAFQLRRYVTEQNSWCEWIDAIVQILCGSYKFSGREFVHEFVRSAYVPRGNRVENYLANLNRDVFADDAQILASLSLADLADFISVCYDKNFSLIRYAENLATSVSSFDEILQSLDSPILTDFLRPLLHEKISQIFGKQDFGESFSSNDNDSPTTQIALNVQDTLFCISVPFPGCFVSALFCAREIKNLFGKKAFISIGGGYVNTELRDVKEKRLFDFCDILSFDKGCGSYFQLFEFFKQSNYSMEETHSFLRNQNCSFYKMRYLNDKNVVVSQLDNDEKYENLEKQTLVSIIPDFSTIDFAKYPRLSDDQNPMHRIWNDGAWIKAFMAYGCYWHRCTFCDTSLDYVKNYCSTNISNLFDGLYKQAEIVKVYGIHFVDEACPPAAMQKFALKNLNISKTKQKFTFWGNIRFEKTFSRDLADLLAKGGLTAVSAGIEVATGKGLNSVNKGTDIENIISACCAFKEAGILIHSYMIFGFWNQSEQDLIDSMETLRQMFQAGLLDSAFWHKFSLTKHSTVFREWKEGKHPELKPIVNENQFAENALSFVGEEQSEKYSEPLNSALNFWMERKKLSKNVESYFPFKMPKPSVSKNFVENLIQKYEEKKNAAFQKEPTFAEKFVWLGGNPIIVENGKTRFCADKSHSDIYENHVSNKPSEQSRNQYENLRCKICWTFMGELYSAEIDKNKSDEIKKLLNQIKAENFENKISEIAINSKNPATSESVKNAMNAAKTENAVELFYGERIIKILGKKLFFELRGKGLCKLI